MKVMSQSGYIYFFLIGMLSMQGCNSKHAEGTGSGTDTSSKHTVVPPPSTYVSYKEGWLVNLDDAYAKSWKEKKPILANFTGSDWNGWCKKLDQDVFSTPVFKSWAEKNVVLLEVDFPKRRQIPQKNQEQNAAMARSLNVTTYPTVWILHVTREPANSRFKVQPIGKTEYQDSPEKFIGVLQNFLRR